MPYASEEETNALIKPDTRSKHVKRLNELTSKYENEGYEYESALYLVALELIEKYEP